MDEATVGGNIMNAEEMIEYLRTFPKDSEINFIVANPDKDVRIVFPVQEVKGILKDEDWQIPCLLISVGTGEPLD